jgi:hypothetical protein
MKLDFNKPFIGLDGNAVPDHPTLGKLLGNAIAAQGKGDVLKLFSWAMDLYQGKAIDLDKSDQKTLQDFITNDQTITILGKGQLLQVFDQKQK